MAVANTLAYYDTETITAVKRLIVQAPGLIFMILASLTTSTLEPAGNTNIKERLSTIDLLIEVACFSRRLMSSYKKELI
jgi:hypothetical protein